MDKDTKKNISGTTLPDKEAFRAEYEKYEKNRYAIINELKEQIETLLSTLNSNLVISGRIKNFNSYFVKHIRLLKDGQKVPLITDLMGVRIICPFIEDLESTEEIITKNFVVAEREKKCKHNYTEFGYESLHLLIKIPQSLIEKYGHPGIEIAEVQIRTILQDAWAEVEHELIYKAEFSLFSESMKRKLAAVNASLSLADIIFQDIRSQQRIFSKEIEERRDSFYDKIEASIDNFLFIDEQNNPCGNKDSSLNNLIRDDGSDPNSIEDLLVKALTAHNNKRFNEAIRHYTRIIELKSDNDAIRTIVYNHRGMANFACSNYEQAINDFSSSLELDNKLYKAAYFRGVVKSVLCQYSQAIEDYTLSLSINPYQSFCLFRRGQAYYHLGDFPQALADCEGSLALEPDNHGAAKFKEFLLEKLNL